MANNDPTGYIPDNPNTSQSGDPSGYIPDAEQQQGEISAGRHAPSTGIGSDIENYANDIKSDLMQGTNNTGLGHVLRYMGAQPLAAGQGEGAANAVAAIPLGATKVIQGVGQLGQSGKRLQGAGNVIGGALQAGSELAPFFPGEIVGAANNYVAQPLSNAGEAIGQGAGRVLYGPNGWPVREPLPPISQGLVPYGRAVLQTPAAKIVKGSLGLGGGYEIGRILHLW